jgi:histone H3/H4
MFGPVRRSSRVEIPATQKKQASKRKTIDLSDSEYDAEEDAPSITISPQKRTPKKRKTVVAASSADVEKDAPSIVSAKSRVGGRSIPPNVPDVPMDNVSFHFIDSAAKWKFVYHRRLTLERELSDEALDCKDVIDLIRKAGLMKTVSGIGECYEKLVKEFIVNIAEDCDNPLSKEYHKVFVRGKCVEFSPAVINRYLGRKKDGYTAVEVTNNQVCKTITADQDKVWPMKGKVPSVMLSVKYAILNRIGAINWFPTTHSSTIATGLARFIYSIGTGTDADYGSCNIPTPKLSN